MRSWSARQLIESSADWALQPAITRVDGTLVIFWNRMLSTNTNYQFYYRTLSGGTLTGAGDVAVSGLTTWSAGTMSGAGHTRANGGINLPASGSNVTGSIVY